MNPIARHAGRQRQGICVSALLGSILFTSTAAAMDRGSASGGVRYVSGGIGLAERSAMYAERGQHRLWIATVARGSGAYLTDAEVQITPAAGGEPVLQRKMDGPWMFVDLPPGRYAVTATLPANDARPAITERAQVQVQASGLRQAVLRFPVRADVAPERAKPFGGNPFGASAPH